MVASSGPSAAQPWRWRLSLSPAVESIDSEPDLRAGGLSVWFAGELDERDAAVASVPPAATDAAFVLAAYRAHGVQAIGRLRGRFALAVSDRNEGRAIVARDHAGLQPLFYRIHDSHLVCAPTALTLAEAPGSAVRFNRAALADAVCRRFPFIDETCFADVRRLPGGALATLTGGRVRVERYWDPIPADLSDLQAAPATAEELEFARRRAVRRCVGHQRVAILLSGGLDSVSIAAAAADDALAGGGELPMALSLGIPAAAADERPIQRAVAASLDLPFRMVDFHAAVGPRSLVAQALDLNGLVSSPLVSPWQPPYLTLAGTARALGRTVILTGIGGDEFFSSSPFVAADRLRRGDVVGARRFIRTFGRSQMVGTPWWSMAARPIVVAAAERVFPSGMAGRRAARRLAGDPGWLSVDPILTAEREARARTPPPLSPWRMGLARAEIRSLILDHVSTSIEMEEHEELGGASGVTYRHPYLDPDLIDVLMRTPADVINQGGWLKGILRGPLARRFPTCRFDVQPKRFVDDFYRQTVLADGVMEERLRQGLPALSAVGVLDGPSAAAEALEWVRSPRAFNRAWHLLSLESWVDARLRARRIAGHTQGVGVAS